MKRRLIAGLAAHVDAGKTSLSEAILYLSGTVRRQGRVDHGDAFLDTDPMEKERGITIFSKQAVLEWNKTDVTLMDTPGHTDFSGETERVLGLLDLCVLVVSATDGVQSHTRTLWRLLDTLGIPVVFFVNKTDISTVPRRELLLQIETKLTDRVVDFTARDLEKIALCDEAALEYYLREGDIPERRITELVRTRRLFPCFFGSALRAEGVRELMDFLVCCVPERSWPAEFGAQVYKIARDPQGARLTFMKITGGALRPRDLLTLRDSSGETVWAEKAAELRSYSGARWTQLQEAEAGMLCCAVGLSKALPGDGLGAAPPRKETLLTPCFSYSVRAEQGTDPHFLLKALSALEEEEPLIRTAHDPATGEIRIQSMGDVYLEILARRLKDRFGITVSYSPPGVVYRETIAAPVEGIGHFEPLRHYAEVHLLLSPLPAGSGLKFRSEVSTDELALNWQRLILTHLKEKTHLGVLTGSPVTDLEITLIAGRAHPKHTEGGDFRQATYRAVRQGLMKAQSVLLEPYVRAEFTLPESALGRALHDLSMMGGEPETPQPQGDGSYFLCALAPASRLADYGREVIGYTRGKGTLRTVFDSYRPCSDAESVIARLGYDPTADTANPPDSVFCSHGAGYLVPWDEVDSHAHLPTRRERMAARQTEAPVRTSAPATDEELRAIFERTYGPIKARALARPEPSGNAEPVSAPRIRAEREILLIDGYNLLHAIDELKETARSDLSLARQQLTDLLSNFAGFTGKRVILVFDAYRVKGNPGTAERVGNLFVIYTAEAQTADAYIEQTAYRSDGKYRFRVVTSDGPEQLIALGSSAMRTSSREFVREIVAAQGSIAEFLRRLPSLRGEKTVERALKDAWRKKAEANQASVRENDAISAGDAAPTGQDRPTPV